MTTGIAEKHNHISFSGSEDSVNQYLQEIRQFPLLNAQEEKELALRCAAGDEDAIRTMVNSNLRLVVSVAKEYAGRGVPLLDLIQEGSIALIAAARKFDAAMDIRFSTYATKWIRHAVYQFVMEYSGVIRIPRHTAERIRALLRSQKALQQNDLTPTIEQIAEHSGIPEEKARELMHFLPEVCSLDAEDQDVALQLLIENVQASQPQEMLIRQEMRNRLESLLAELTPRQQQVLRLRFGMEDGICHTLESIGNYFGISKARARQIEQQAVAKLKKLGAGLGLEDFLE